jgi:hypothetical protein
MRMRKRSKTEIPDQMLIKKEPWGQTASRFLSTELLLVGITFTPSMRERR